MITKKIFFIADFFKKDIIGGAESNDEVLIQYLSTEYNVERVRCYDFDKKTLDKKNIFLISNFASLSPENKKLLENEYYIIYEHDHKYIKTRDPSLFKDFVVPNNQLANETFYQNAKAVVVLSNICQKIIAKNLHIDNVYNIGCSLWSDEKLDFIETLISQKKNEKFAIIGSENPIKNTYSAMEYCRKNNIDCDMIDPCPEKELLVKLSSYKGLVFFPGVLETFSRISAEAKMLNCQLLTKPKLLGFASEEIYKLSGLELLQQIRQRKKIALDLFSELIEKIK